MKKSRFRSAKAHSVSDLYVFALFGMLAIFSLLIVIFGAKLYHNIVDTTQINNDVRSSVQYLTNKIRSSDQIDSINVIEIDGIQILELSNIYEDANYRVFIYYYDYAIRELLTDDLSNFDPAQGDAITTAEAFSVQIQDNLIFFEVTDGNGSVYGMHIALQSSQQR